MFQINDNISDRKHDFTLGSRDKNYTARINSNESRRGELGRTTSSKIRKVSLKSSSSGGSSAAHQPNKSKKDRMISKINGKNKK